MSQRPTPKPSDYDILTFFVCPFFLLPLVLVMVLERIATPERTEFAFKCCTKIVRHSAVCLRPQVFAAPEGTFEGYRGWTIHLCHVHEQLIHCKLLAHVSTHPTRVGHLRCEGVAERKCRNDRSGFYRLRWLAIFSKNVMRKLVIFQVVSNVSLVAETGSRRRAEACGNSNCQS